MTQQPKVEPVFLRMRDLPPIVGLAIVTIYEKIRRGDFPEPDARIGRSPVWRPATIAQWAEDRAGVEDTDAARQRRTANARKAALTRWGKADEAAA